MTTTKRKGARSIKDIPAAILEQLNAGELESANLVEWLAVDQKSLLANLLRQTGRTAYLPAILARINALKKQTVNTLNEAIGIGLFEASIAEGDVDLLPLMFKHPSDMVRCWATYCIGGNPSLSISQKLEQIKPFAADEHFGVREICWMAIRPDIAAHLEISLSILSQWALDTNAYIRRFASESTRPRGVWCTHLETLKQNPEKGLTILEPLKSDPSRYVQDSVGNWLNDAGKSQPQFVKNICQNWERESLTKETAYIVRKAMRSMGLTS